MAPPVYGFRVRSGLEGRGERVVAGDREGTGHESSEFGLELDLELELESGFEVSVVCLKEGEIEEELLQFWG